MKEYKKFKIGQWVKSYSKGIHRIEEFVPVVYEEYDFLAKNPVIKREQIGTLKKEPLVVLKRLFNSKFKKQIGADFCSASFLKSLTTEEQNNLDETLKLNPKYLIDIEKYVLPKYETRMGQEILLNSDNIHIFKDLAKFIRNDGKTFTEIFEWLEINGIKKLLYNSPPHEDKRIAYYLQFINYSFEARDNRMLFSDLLAFTPNYIKIDTE